MSKGEALGECVRIRQGIEGGETGRVWRRADYDGRLPLLTIRFEARGGGGGGKK